MGVPQVKKLSIQEIEPDLRSKAALFDQPKDGFLSAAEVDKNNNGYLDADFIAQGKITPLEYDRLQYALFRKGVLSKFRPPSSASSLPEGVKIITEIEGDPKVGTVIYVRQFHDRPEFDDIQKEVVADYQYEILKFLTDRKENEVFPEGQTEEVSPGEIDFLGEADQNQMLLDFLRDVFKKNPLSKTYDKIQQESLKKFSGSHIYAALNSTTALHRTISPEKDKEIFKKISHSSSGDSLISLIFDEREALATEEIKKFLDKNPGKTVALIYGSGHEFKDDFMKWKNPPVLVSVQFGDPDKNDIRVARLRVCSETDHPLYENKNRCRSVPLHNLDYSHPEKLTPFFALSQDRSLLQSQIIQKADRISVWSFQYIVSEQDQLNALDKMSLDGMLIAKKYFLDKARSKVVVQKIEKKFSEMEKPIEDLVKTLKFRLSSVVPFF